MKILIGIILTGVLTFILGEWGPWWLVFIAPIPATIYFNYSSRGAALTGYIGVGLCWLIYSFAVSIPNDFLMVARAGAMFGGLSGIAYILVSSFLGGIFGAIGALLGWSISHIFNPKNYSILDGQ